MSIAVVSADLQSVIIKAGRSIAGIVPNVAVDEVSLDSITVTDHPVEFGAQISDHAYANPAQLTLRWGWSDTSIGPDGAQQPIGQLYEKLLGLARARQPIDVVTGRRAYTNMLITSIAAPNSRETENSLLVQVSLREIIVVRTAATTLAAENQATPQQTAAPTNIGTVQPKALDAAKVPPQILQGAGGQ